MITVHHLETSRSHRVLWMLEELGLPYELVRYARDKTTFLAPKALRDVHPLGKSPVITEDGQAYAESGAILEYLVERHGGGRFAPAPGTPEFTRYRYFMHYAEGSLMTPLLMKFVCERVKSAPLPFFIKPVARRIADGVGQQFTDPNLREHLAFVDAELARGPWFAGDFSAADVQMSFPINGLLTRAAGLGPLDRVREFMTRIRERPAYRRAVERGGEPM